MLIESPKILFSYGINNAVKGKSTLLNQLFGTNFEMTFSDENFRGTADIQGEKNFLENDKKGFYVCDFHGETKKKEI